MGRGRRWGGFFFMEGGGALRGCVILGLLFRGGVRMGAW